MKNATIEPTEKTKIRKSQIEKQTKAKRKNISLYCIVNGFLRLGLPLLLSSTNVEWMSTNVKPTSTNVKPTATNNKPIAAGQTNGLLQFPLSVGRRRSKIG